MSKKAPDPPASEGAPEWMVSYADLITIMMAFFVVMYAMAPKRDSEKEEAQVQKLMDSLNHRFGPEWRPFAFTGPTPRTDAGSTTPAASKKLKPPPGEDDEGGKPKRRQKSRIQVPGRGDRSVIGGMVFFDEFSAELSDEQVARLRVIAAEMVGKPQKIQLLGHTSKRPLPKDLPFKDHWDLAYARCRNTLKHLVEMGIEPERIRAGSAGNNEPTHTGVDPVLMKQNSRVEVFLLDVLTEELIGSPNAKEERGAKPEAKPEPAKH